MEAYTGILSLLEGDEKQLKEYYLSTFPEKDLDTYLKNLNLLIYTYYNLNYERDFLEVYKENEEKIKEIKLGQEGFCLIKAYLDANVLAIKLCPCDCISEAIEFIDKNYRKKICLDDLAKEIHISKNYLCKLFREKTGYTFCQYLNLVRIMQAKKLIDQGENFNSIAFKCGFCSQAHFCTNFKKITGFSPKEYKSNNNQKISE